MCVELNQFEGFLHPLTFCSHSDRWMSCTCGFLVLSKTGLIGFWFPCLIYFGQGLQRLTLYVRGPSSEPYACNNRCFSQCPCTAPCQLSKRMSLFTFWFQRLCSSQSLAPKVHSWYRWTSETIKILPSLRPRVNMFESGRSVASLGQNDGLRGILSLMVFRSLEGFFCQADSAFRPSEFVSFVILVGFEKKPRGSFRDGLCWATDHGAALRVCLASIVCVCGRCGSSPLTSRIAPDGSTRSGPV